jgi:hypothetical protein
MVITENNLYQISEFKIYFQNKNDLLIDFLHHLNCDNYVNNKLFMDFLINGFIENCGVSKGKRTVYWDIAWNYLGINSNLWFDGNEPTMNSYFEKYYPDEFQESKKYDIAIFEKGDYIRIVFGMFSENEIPDIFKPSFCRSLYLLISSFDEL